MQKAYLNSRRYKNTLNPRTLLTVVISIISCYLVIHFDIRIHHDLMFFGLIISFPVVFSLQSAFERRDRAIEYLAKFKAGLTAVFRCATTLPGLRVAEKEMFRDILSQASDALLLSLREEERPLQESSDAINKIYLFLEKHQSSIGMGVHSRIIRLMFQVEEGAAYLLGLREHRTISLLRIFAFIFINLFPFLQASLLYATLSNVLPEIVIYLASALTSLTLISMYNIQVQLEYPFDQIGPDDIHIGNFMFEKQEFYRTSTNESFKSITTDLKEKDQRKTGTKK